MTWKKTKISELAKGIRGVTFGANNLNEEVGESNFFLLRSNNIQKSNLTLKDVLIVDEQCVSEKQRLKKGDILVCMSNGSRILVGKNAIFNLSDLNYCVGAFCSSFRPYENSVPDFVFQLFQSDDYKRKIDVILAGSAINNLTNNQIEEFEFLLPTSKIEQKRIAEILSTADEAIEQTQALIDKYNRIKRGLMQDLLTRGIDENGNIRSKQTHKFTVKNGIEVPDDWDIVRFDECYLNPIRDFGSFSSTKMIEFLEEGIPFIKSEMIEVGNINWSSVSFISPEIHKLLNKSYVRKGNLLFSKIGSALGKAVVYELDEECNSNAAVAKVELNPKKANSYFITYFLNFEFAQTQFKNMIVSLLPRLNLGDISSLTVMLPKISEQERIVSILVSVENHIKKELKKLIKLKSTKRGLMQDLLSGKVRVKLETGN